MALAAARIAVGDTSFVSMVVEVVLVTKARLDAAASETMGDDWSADDDEAAATASRREMLNLMVR